jgi:hypothetical protein
VIRCPHCGGADIERMDDADYSVGIMTPNVTWFHCCACNHEWDFETWEGEEL